MIADTDCLISACDINRIDLLLVVLSNTLRSDALHADECLLSMFCSGLKEGLSSLLENEITPVTGRDPHHSAERLGNTLLPPGPLVCRINGEDRPRLSSKRS